MKNYFINKQKIGKWLKEIARDCLAIGSIPIFIIVAARSTLGNNYNYVYQILIAALILFILSLTIKSQNHIARAIIIYIFTILFYNNKTFTYFATFLLILTLTSLIYLKYNKKEIFFGILFGILSSGASYFILNKFP